MRMRARAAIKKRRIIFNNVLQGGRSPVMFCVWPIQGSQIEAYVECLSLGLKGRVKMLEFFLADLRCLEQLRELLGRHRLVRLVLGVPILLLVLHMSPVS